jgi:hypothetical protein
MANWRPHDPFQLELSRNSVEFIGHFNITQLQRALVGLDALIGIRGYKEVILDFSRCTFTHAPPMLAVATASEFYQERGVKFTLVLPEDAKVARLFLNSNWAHIIAPDAFQLSEFKSAVHMPALRYTNADEQHHLVDGLLNRILGSITDFDRSHFTALEWSINEITDNVLVHSESPRGGLVQLTAMKTSKKIEFVVCDSGMGIPRSLRSSGLAITSDADALAMAIEQGVTRDKTVGQGNGLYGSYQIAVKSGANFSVHSGKATLFYSPKRGMHSRTGASHMPGTIVVCAIDYTQPLLLEDALNIKSKGYTPVDLIEVKYESTSEGDILFVLRDESDSFGSRIAGSPVRNKLKNLFRFLEGNKVTVDLGEIHLISSSFADEVFGKLFVELGPLEFNAKLELRNVDPLVKLLIDKAILQRMTTKH